MTQKPLYIYKYEFNPPPIYRKRTMYKYIDTMAQKTVILILKNMYLYIFFHLKKRYLYKSGGFRKTILLL